MVDVFSPPSDTDAEKRRKMFEERFIRAKNAHETHAAKWRRWQKVYDGTQKLKNEDASTLKIKWAWQRWQALSPELMDPEPKLSFRPVEVGDEKYSQAIKQLVRAQLSQDKFVIKQPGSVHDAGIFGLGVFKVLWVQKHKTLMVRNPDLRNASPIQRILSMGKKPEYVKKTVITENRPSIMYVDPFDFFWDPAATTDQDWQYVFHRVYMTKQQLKDWERQGILTNVDKACMASDTGVRIGTENTEERDERSRHKYEVIEGWFKDGTRMIVSGNVVMHDGPNPYHHQDIPFVTWCTNPNERSLVGFSEMEPIEDLQRAIWRRDNQRIQATDLALMGIIVADPTIKDIKNLKFEAGTVVHAMAGQRFEQFTISPQVAGAIEESSVYLSAIDAMTGYNSVLQGSNPDGMDRVAATVGTIAKEATSLRKAMKKLQFRLAIARMAKMWVQLDNQFLSDYELRRILGDMADDIGDIVPEEIPMFLDVIPEAMNESLSVTQERSANLDLFNLVQGIHGIQMMDGSTFDMKESLENLIRSYDREPQSSFVPPQPQPPMEQQAPQGGGDAAPTSQNDADISDENPSQAAIEAANPANMATEGPITP